jgi:antitoxin VapB
MFLLGVIRYSKIDICRSICQHISMGEERHVRLFRNGRSQAVRIPRDFELPGNDAIMRQVDGKLVIEAAPEKSLKRLLALMDSWEPLPKDEQFPEIDDLTAEPFDLDDL